MIIIKKYTQFIKESSEYKYGCIMIETPFPNWKEITSMISPEDLYDREEGDFIQENPHLTIFYGLHSNVKTEVVEDVFRNFTGDIKIEGTGIGIFENEEFDVVKFNINPQGSLQSLFNEFMKLPNSCTYTDYSPHITIAYVKKGCGQKYINDKFQVKVDDFDRVCYSMPNGEKTYFYI
jgi:2'-5' RNA ligase